MISNLNRWIRSQYFSDSGEPSWFTRLMVPLVPLYRGGRRINQLVRTLRKQRLSTPVISIGNISVGGTGKTAFTSWLIERLREDSWSPAILKRGQGEDEGILGLESKSPPSNPGDESQWLHHQFPEIPIGVGANRYRSGRVLEESTDVDVFVLDDGFQHRQLARDLDVVLLGSPGELDDWQLPAGPLREPPSTLDRADVVSLNRTGDRSDQPVEQCLDGWHPRKDQVLLSHRYQFQGIFRGGDDMTDDTRQRPVHLLSTQARPERLQRFLEEHGIHVDNHLDLGDHAALETETIRSELDVDRLVVTPKEWIKLSPELQKRAGRIESELEVENKERFLRETRALLEEKHS